MGAKAPFEARGQRERRAQSASVFFGPIPFGPYGKGGTGFVNKKESGDRGGGKGGGLGASGTGC